MGVCSNQYYNLIFCPLHVMTLLSQIKYALVNEISHVHSKNYSTEFWDLILFKRPDNEVIQGNQKQEERRCVL